MTLSRSVIFLVIFTKTRCSWGISLAKFCPTTLDFGLEIILAIFLSHPVRPKYKDIQLEDNCNWPEGYWQWRHDRATFLGQTTEEPWEEKNIGFRFGILLKPLPIFWTMVFRTNQRKLRGLDWFCWLICSEEKILSNRFYSFFVTFNRKIAMKPEDICYGSWQTQFWTSLATSDFL